MTMTMNEARKKRSLTDGAPDFTQTSHEFTRT